MEIDIKTKTALWVADTLDTLTKEGIISRWRIGEDGDETLDSDITSENSLLTPKGVTILDQAQAEGFQPEEEGILALCFVMGASEDVTNLLLSRAGYGQAEA